jgi:peptidoglycan/LPS O-acetylase OafA/YrhL
MQKSHLSSLDWLRGIAALMVCFFHFAYANEDYLGDTNILKIISRYGYLGVDIFFVISGFIIPYSMHRANFRINKYGNFILRRFTRIEPPYLFSIALVLFIGWISTLSPYYRGAEFHINVPGLMSHLGYFTAILGYEWINPVYWTLAIEFQYYLVIGVLIYFLSQKGKKIIIYLTIIGMLISSFLIPNSNFVFHYFPLFLAGIITFQLKQNIISKVEFVIFVLATFIALFLIFPLPSFLAVIFAFVFINWIEFETKISRQLGNISYSLYLIHISIGARLVNFSENFIHDDIMRTGLVFIAVAVSVTCAWVFYRMIEFPFQKLSKKIKY